MMEEQMTQALAIGAAVNPQIINNAYVNSGVIDMSECRRALFVLEIGAVTGGGSITASLQESAASGSGFAANGTAGAFSNSSGLNTQMTALTTANKQYTFEVNAEQLTNGKRYVRLNVGETGSENVYVTVVALGGEGIHKPNSANNDASVAAQDVVA